MTEYPATSDDEPSRWQVLRARLLAMVVRPTARPLGWGIVVAVRVHRRRDVDRAVPHAGRPGERVRGHLPSRCAGGVGGLEHRSGDRDVDREHAGVPVLPPRRCRGRDVRVPAAGAAGELLAGQARLRAAEADERRRQADALAKQQTALRRVATLVARGADPAEVYPVTVTELARGLDVEHVTLVRFDPDDSCTVLAAHDRPDRETLHVGERLPLDGESISGRIRASGAAARIDDYAGVGGTIASRMRGLGLHSGAGAPVTVDDKPRGALIVGSIRHEPLPRGTEERICDFADLVATAIANAETRAELKASRARIVAASDQARRRFERDLHDGAQQRIVALGLGLRTIEASVPQQDQAIRKQLDNVINGMADLYTNLQELSRGIHPAILSKGGLGPALRALARRSVVPVSIQVDVDRRLPEPVEVAAYYVVAEALTNAAKHAEASEVVIRVGLGADELYIEVADDGVGGATSTGGGSGLVGLRDRVEAVSGRIDVSSPPGEGTTLTARIPKNQSCCQMCRSERRRSKPR